MIEVTKVHTNIAMSLLLTMKRLSLNSVDTGGVKYAALVWIFAKKHGVIP